MTSGPYSCKFEGCSFISDSLTGLKQHLIQAHNLKHPITRLEVLSNWGYEEKEETKTIKFKMNIKSLGVL